MVAGGFLRDSFRKQPFKDIDIFISCEASDFCYFTEEVIPKVFNFNPSYVQLIPSSNGSHVFSHDLTINATNTPYQFILSTQKLEAILSKFDFSINKIWMLSNGDIHYDSTFKNTMEDHVIFQYDNVTPDRFKYFQQRFPEFKIKPMKETKRSRNKKLLNPYSEYFTTYYVNPPNNLDTVSPDLVIQDDSEM